MKHKNYGLQNICNILPKKMTCPELNFMLTPKLDTELSQLNLRKQTHLGINTYHQKLEVVD